VIGSKFDLPGLTRPAACENIYTYVEFWFFGVREIFRSGFVTLEIPEF
jgi:hypothetical protein